MRAGSEVPFPHWVRLEDNPLSKSSENTQLDPSSAQRCSTAAAGGAVSATRTARQVAERDSPLRNIVPPLVPPTFPSENRFAESLAQQCEPDPTLGSRLLID